MLYFTTFLIYKSLVLLEYIYLDKELDELELRYKKLVQKGNTTEEEDLDDIER